MINPKIKHNISSGQQINIKDFSQMLDIIIDAKKHNNSFSITRDDTASFIQDSFPQILNRLSNGDLKDMIYLLKNKGDNEKKEVLIELLRNNIISFAERINRCDPLSTYTISNIFQVSADQSVEKIFKGQLSAFYNKLRNPAFEFLNIFDSRDQYGKDRNLFSTDFCAEIDSLYMSLIEDKTINPKYVRDVLRHLLLNGQKDFIQNNIEAIAHRTDTPLKTLAALSNRKLDVTSYIQVINQHRVNDAIHEMVSEKLDINFEESKDAMDIITLVIKELMQKENIPVSQIRPVGEGGYSRAFRIGSKIVKIGREPKEYKITKNSKRFLQPLLRKNLSVAGRLPDDNFQMNITVTELCNINHDISDDQLYQIYKELRDEGLVWTDCKASNLGVLRKDNIVHYSTNTHSPDEASNNGFYVHHTNVGFEEPRRIEILPAGELVILDLDYIYDITDYQKGNYVIPSGGNRFKELEERYQKEKREDTIIDSKSDEEISR